MKRLYFEWIWQWVRGPFMGFNPIGVEFEYDAYYPSISVMVVVLGVGLRIMLMCPWETVESKEADGWEKDAESVILSIDPAWLREKDVKSGD